MIALGQGCAVAALVASTALMPDSMTGALVGGAAILGLAASAIAVWRTGKNLAETQADQPEDKCTVEPAAPVRTNVKASLFEQAARLHLADRVAFLHACDRVLQKDLPQTTLSVRLDVSGDGQQARFVDRILTICRDGDGVAVDYATPASTDQQMPAPAGVDEGARAAVEHQKKLLAIVSHELRTPLNAIIGFSQMLSSGLAGELSDPRQREYVDLIANSGADLLELVNTILDVSKIDAGAYTLNREPFDLDKTIRDSIRLVEAKAGEKSIHILVRPMPDLGETCADRRAVRQILINLLSNAVKFTPDGGCITVEVAADAKGDGFAISVTDTGIGMSQEQLAMIGTPFRQGDSSYAREMEGTGLGLALVKGLVELHGGTLDAQSDPSIGTAFTASFPHQDGPLQRIRSEAGVAVGLTAANASHAPTPIRKAG